MDKIEHTLADFFAEFRLTPAQRRIAQTFTEHPSEAAFMSSTEVAKLAGVSQPSVTRLAAAVGFSSYAELRRRLREIVDGGPRDDSPQLNEYETLIAADIENLQALSRFTSDREPARHAGRLLTETKPLPVVGLRVASAFARYFAFYAERVHPDVRVLDHSLSVVGDRLDRAVRDGATAALFFSLPRHDRETVTILRQARDLELTIVTVTDLPHSKPGELSDLVIPAPVGRRAIFDSHAAAVMAATVLLQAMCDADPRQTQTALERYEQSARARRVYVS